MAESGKGCCDVLGHGEANGSCSVVPLEVDPAEEVSVPVRDCLILVVEVVDEVDGVLSACVLYPKVIDNKTKGDRLGSVFEQPCC